MPMTLVFKRAKCFVEPSENDKGTKKFLAQAGPANPIPVPFWVAGTATFKQGIKDGSIVNLTPPTQMPDYKAPKVEEADYKAPKTSKVEEADDDPTGDKAAGNGSDAGEDVEQTEAPEAPFGGQPMTPVTPAPKVGQVRASGRKTQQ